MGFNSAPSVTPSPESAKPKNEHSSLRGKIRKAAKNFGISFASLLTSSAMAQNVDIQMLQGKKVVPTEQATEQDSMDVYNNAKVVDSFYANNKWYERTKFDPKLHQELDIEKYNEENDDEVRSMKGYLSEKSWSVIFPHVPYPKSDSEVEAFAKKHFFGKEIDSVATPQGKRELADSEYRQNIDKYKYKQRELMRRALNTDAPMQLFDRRIQPQEVAEYKHKKFPPNYKGLDKDMEDDHVEIYRYDPVAVKPYKLLTPEEKKVREEKYSKAREYRIYGDLPDSLRGKSFKTKKEAQEFIKTLPTTKEE